MDWTFNETYYPSSMNKIFFSSLFGLLVTVLFWFIYSYIGLIYLMHFSLIFIFCCSSSMVYIFVLISWSSNSNYSVLGIIQFILQMISHEAWMMVMIINLMFLISSLNLNNFFI